MNHSWQKMCYIYHLFLWERYLTHHRDFSQRHRELKESPRFPTTTHGTIDLAYKASQLNRIRSNYRIFLSAGSQHLSRNYVSANRLVTIFNFQNRNNCIIYYRHFITGGLDDLVYHLHGYNFYVVGARQFGRNMLLQDIKNLDKRRQLFSRNLDCAPIKDTVVVPKFGAVALRFKADNPGKLFRSKFTCQI